MEGVATESELSAAWNGDSILGETVNAILYAGSALLLMKVLK